MWLNQVVAILIVWDKNVSKTNVSTKICILENKRNCFLKMLSYGEKGT